MALLSVNLNKIAVLRNSRGGHEPSMTAAADAVITAGAGGITLHPRPDQRHVRPSDVHAVAARLQGRVEYNLEGNPFAPARGDYPGFLALVEAVRPTQATLVPDGDGQLTSDHGFDLARDAARLEPMVRRLKQLGTRVSLFMDAGAPQLRLARELGADRIELYTGPYAQAAAAGDARGELSRCRETALEALELGLGLNAGHDLSQANLGPFLMAVPGLLEVSIGHALIGEALYQGLANTVAAYLDILRADTRG